MIIFFVSIVSLILALLHVVIYKTIISIFVFSFAWRLVLAITLTILCTSFVVSELLAFNLNNLFIRIYYTISATWLGFSFFLFLASCIYAIVALILKIFNTNFASIQQFGIIILSIAVIVSIYSIIHARAIFIKYIDVDLPHLPDIWFGKKAVFVSDMHLGAVNGQKFLKNIVSNINKINPDIIFIGGDLYDGVKVNESEIIKPLSELHPPLGTYFITGNHEEFRDNKPYLKAIRDVGVRVLNNEMVTIDGLQLVGVDDKDSVNAQKFETILFNLNINKKNPTVLLKHQPSQLMEAARAGVSLQISGHTHRAQVFPLNIFTSFAFKGYDYGLHMYDDMAVYTSSGVGTWGPPLRLGSDSEIVVFRFGRNKK